jgi:hypothetical protein
VQTGKWPRVGQRPHVRPRWPGERTWASRKPSGRHLVWCHGTPAPRGINVGHPEEPPPNIWFSATATETMSSKGHFRCQKFCVTCAESVIYAKSERFRVGGWGSRREIEIFGPFHSGNGLRGLPDVGARLDREAGRPRPALQRLHWHCPESCHEQKRVSGRVLQMYPAKPAPTDHGRKQLQIPHPLKRDSG